MQPFHEAMSMQNPQMTLDEFLAMPEDKTLEWVRGEVVTRAMPTTLHGLVGGLICTHLMNWALATRLGAALIEVRITYRGEDDPRSVIPDVCFQSRARMSGGARHEHQAQAPNLAIEVLSPGQSVAGLADRIDWLLSHGSAVVWIVDGEDRSISVFRNGQPKQVLRQGDSLEDAEVLPGFVLALSQLFEEVDLLSSGDEKPV